MKRIGIGNRFVGEGNPIFIIAEAGVNHNGKLSIAKKLVDAAKKSGADAVKFQTFKAKGVVTKSAKRAEYQIKNRGSCESQQDMLRKLELDYDNFPKLKKYCDKKDITFLSTPHSFDAIDFLEPLVPVYKFGSGDLTNYPVLIYAAKKGKPIIISTGMSIMKEVKDAISAIRSTRNSRIIALHCTTSYPCPIKDVNLRAMQTMQKELDCLVGYSDHALGIVIPIMAVTLGAVMIEKHFTLDKDLPGPDHKASLEPKELEELVKSIREVEIILGSSTKKPSNSEKNIMKLARKSIVALTYIPKGTRVSKEMVTIKRPGTGIQPEYYKDVIGKITKKNIREDEVLTWKSIKNEKKNSSSHWHTSRVWLS